jgi:hypothetical protein
MAKLQKKSDFRHWCFGISGYSFGLLISDDSTSPAYLFPPISSRPPLADAHEKHLTHVFMQDILNLGRDVRKK